MIDFCSSVLQRLEKETSLSQMVWVKKVFNPLFVCFDSNRTKFLLKLIACLKHKIFDILKKGEGILLSGIQSSQLECYVTPNNYYSFHRKKIDLNVTDTTNGFSRILIQHLDNSTELPDYFGWLFSHPSRLSYSIT